MDLEINTISSHDINIKQHHHDSPSSNSPSILKNKQQQDQSIQQQTSEQTEQSCQEQQQQQQQSQYYNYNGGESSVNENGGGGVGVGKTSISLPPLQLKSEHHHRNFNQSAPAQVIECSASFQSVEASFTTPTITPRPPRDWDDDEAYLIQTFSHMEVSVILDAIEFCQGDRDEVIALLSNGLRLSFQGDLNRFSPIGTPHASNAHRSHSFLGRNDDNEEYEDDEEEDDGENDEEIDENENENDDDYSSSSLTSSTSPKSSISSGTTASSSTTATTTSSSSTSSTLLSSSESPLPSLSSQNQQQEMEQSDNQQQQFLNKSTNNGAGSSDNNFADSQSTTTNTKNRPGLTSSNSSTDYYNYYYQQQLLDLEKQHQQPQFKIAKEQIDRSKQPPLPPSQSSRLSRTTSSTALATNYHTIVLPPKPEKTEPTPKIQLSIKKKPSSDDLIPNKQSNSNPNKENIIIPIIPPPMYSHQNGWKPSCKTGTAWDLTVTIISFSKITSFIEYNIHVQTSYAEWVVHRRYNNFLLLDKKIRRCSIDTKPNKSLVPLPPKKLRASSKQVINSRTISLENYLVTLLSTYPGIFYMNPAVNVFFNADYTSDQFTSAFKK